MACTANNCRVLWGTRSPEKKCDRPQILLVLLCFVLFYFVFLVFFCSNFTSHPIPANNIAVLVETFETEASEHRSAVRSLRTTNDMKTSGRDSRAGETLMSVGTIWTPKTRTVVQHEMDVDPSQQAAGKQWTLQGFR